MKNNGINMKGNFILQDIGYNQDRVDTKWHKQFVCMLQGKPEAPWNEYLVQMFCRLQNLVQLIYKGNTNIFCHMKLRLTLQGKWDKL